MSLSNLMNYEVVFWDFDGVLLASNDVREAGFLEVLRHYPKQVQDSLLRFHRENGGLSRYVKFRYLFENILKEEVTDADILEYALKFSEIMRKALTNKELLIDETIDIARMFSHFKPMFIVSGSDQSELRFLCKELGIDEYFKEILGSPTPKVDLVRLVMKKYGYKPENCVLVGDSINDLEAASLNKISFVPYNYVG